MTQDNLERVPPKPNKPPVTPHLPRQAAAAIALVLLALAAYFFLSQDKAAPRPQPGESAPEFTLTTFDGHQLSLQGLRGQVVVLNFWASGCAPCRHEAPALQEVWQSFQDRGVTLVGLTFDDPEQASRSFVREFGLTFPNGADPEGRIAAAYGVTAVPETYIIGPSGRVVSSTIGEIDAEALAAQLDRLLGGQTVRTPAALLTDLDVIAQRLRDDLTASALSQAQALRLVAQLEPGGSWPDVDYADRARTHWSPHQHAQRLAQVAAAYAAHLYAPDEADQLERALLSALAFWVEADPQSDNWWFNSIDTPKYLAQTLLLMGDAVPQPTWEQATAIVRRSGLTRTGANLTWEAGNLLMLACATRDEPLLRQAAAAIAGAVRITTEEGIQPDFSFHQHGPQLYMSNYGEVFSIDNSRYARLLAGTQYAFTDEQINALSGLIREGQQWFLWGGQFDYHALGRQLDRSSAAGRGRSFEGICRRMAEADPAHAAEYADLGARVTGAQPPGASGPTGNRHYWRSDVMVHRPGAFYASVRMNSRRTARTEINVNRENLKGYFLSDGVCFLMRRGDEYHDIQPVWDWRRLPGTTGRETNDPLPYGRSVPRTGRTAFVGGVSDGQTGVATMDYDRDGVRAHKAWFFLPDGWVALGSGIRGATPDPVTTSINQCLLASEVLLLRGGQVAALAGERGRAADPWRGGDLEGVHHDGVAYYLLTPQQTVVRAAPQSGTWTSIQERAPDTGLVTQDVFSLWIDHGARPESAGYAYRVVPGLPAGDLAAYPSRAPVTIVANERLLQAIAYAQANASPLIQAVFYAAGRLELDAGRAIETDAPCLLMLRCHEDGVTLSVADPTQARRRIQIQIAGQYAGPDCTYDPDREVSVIAVDLPAYGAPADAPSAGDWAGQSVQIDLRAG